MRYKSHIYLYPNTLLMVCMVLSILIIMGSCIHIGVRKVSEPSLQKQIETSHHKNGKIEYEVELLNGKLDGMSRHWSEEGVLISESEYSHGKPHGVWKKYHAKQNIMYETHYFHGQKHGKEKWYYDNGQIKSEQTFRYGESIDDIIRWQSDGSIIY